MIFSRREQWLTPSFVPIRFATRYFLHQLRGDQQEELIEGEIVGLDWLTPAEARIALASRPDSDFHARCLHAAATGSRRVARALPVSDARDGAGPGRAQLV